MKRKELKINKISENILKYKNKIIIITLIFFVFSLTNVLAGDIIIKEGFMNITGGNLEVKKNLTVDDTFYVNSNSGKVGIGIINPNRSLDVNGSIRFASGHLITNASNGAMIFNAGPNTSLNQAGFYFRINNILGDENTYTDLVRIDPAGRVGIGTAVPDERLVINGTTNIQIKIVNDVNKTIIAIVGGSDNPFIEYNNGLSFRQNTYDETGNWNGGTDRLIISSNGSVGIGITYPQIPTHKLNVVGSINMTQNLIVDEKTFFVESTNNRVGIGTSNPWDVFHINTGTDENLLVRSINSDIEIASVNDFNSAYQPLRFDASNFYLMNGKVGIGTTAPNSALHVAGEINITGISGDGNGRGVCIKQTGELGTCSTAINGTGFCTCG